MQNQGGAASCWPGLANGDLAALSSAVAFLADSDVTWFGEYGCALLALRPPAEKHYHPAAEQVTLLLVGLDKWEFAVHSGGGSIVDQLPKGGFTDVGLHTGGQARDTAWPLVCQVFKVALQHVASCQQVTAPELYLTAEAHLHLWLLQRQLPLLRPEVADSTVLNAAIQMLGSTASLAAGLAKLGYEVGHFEAACSAARKAVDSAATQRAQQTGATYTLPALEGPESQCGPASWRCPRGTVPSAGNVRIEGNSRDEAIRREERNLGTLPLATGAFQAGHMSFAALLRLLQTQELQRSDDIAAQHALCSVEQELFARAASGSFASEAALDEPDVAALAAVVDAYRTVLHKFQESPSSDSRMAVDLRSRLTLVAWVAYCAIEAACRRQHPDLQPFGVSLDWSAVRHLVLTDRPAVDAALGVAAYLRQHRIEGCAVFTQKDGGAATFRLAEQFARGAQGGVLQETWKQEVAAAKARMQAHWEEVKRKQRLAAKYRAQLQVEEAELRRAQAAYDAAHNSYLSAPKRSREFTHSTALSRCQQEFNGASSAVKATQGALEAALKSPMPVIQPLPRDATIAQHWLFFLYMPPMLRHLARMSFLAQELLVPEATPMEDPKTYLVQHYNGHQEGPYHGSTGRRGTEGTVWMLSYYSVPKKVSLANVDCYASPEDGVYYPDHLAPHMGWQGTGHSADHFSGWRNPFADIADNLIVEAYTEALPPEASMLEWAMLQYGSGPATDPKRGNLAIAQQDQKPHWLSKHGFLAFGALRAYPLIQFRQLCETLHKRCLPLGQPAVQTLVRQLLYHLGTLRRTSPPALLWRSDWAEPGDMLITLCEELTALAAELDQAPREHAAVLLLGEVAAYLSAWHGPLAAVARSFAGMAERWAEELEPNASGAPPDQAGPVRAKQCLLRCTALLCYGPLEELRAEDVGAMLRLAVQAHHGFVYGPGTKLERQLGRLQRAPIDLAWVQLAFPNSPSGSFRAEGSDGHLYSINCLDGTVLQDGSPPRRLPTEILGHRLYKRTFGTWGFEVSLGTDGVHRSINPVNGHFYEFAMSTSGELVVTELDERRRRLELLDVGADRQCGEWGTELPPRLKELHSHWLSRQHDVHFLLHWDTNGSTAEAVDLVCHRVPCELQSKSWRKLLAERGTSLTDQLLLHQSPIINILSKFEREEFIHVYVRALAGCENNSSSSGGSSAVHADSSTDELRATAEHTMIFSLPRFSLEFELRSGRLWSLEYNASFLHHCQQLVAGDMYTLPGFSQYLVLQQHQAQQGQPGSPPSAPGSKLGGLRVLIPAGQVQSSTKGVEVAHDGSSGAHLEVHRYDAHPRFSHLHATSPLGRLQLAALHAATGSLLPEPVSQATGSQVGMRLLREAWGTKPLSKAELEQLRSTAQLGGHMAAGLRLLAYEVQASASQLNALHFPDGAPECALMPACNPDWRLAYLQEHSAAAAQATGLNPRLKLTAGEEQRTLCHHAGPPPPPPLWKRLKHYQPVDVPCCPVPQALVADMEAKLCQLVQRGIPRAATTAAGGAATTTLIERPAYPLLAGAATSAGAAPTPLEQEMHDELADSWRAHHSMHATAGVLPHAREIIQQAKIEVQVLRQMAEDYLLKYINAVPEAVGLHGAAHRLLQTSNVVPLPGLLDCARLALRSEWALAFNPFLSKTALHRLQMGARQWLQLCVLEDRLDRLVQVAATLGDPGQEALLIQELQVRREWDVAAHPEWLVFEAEGQLQIRPVQYWVAHYLINNMGSLDKAGAIVQLNMGEGKTRVILPMLILHWGNGKDIVRLNLLPQLLNEAYAHMQSCLSAGVLARKLFVMPFHRDVKVDLKVLEAMRSALMYCQLEGGVLLTTPERRLSLLLKRQELWERGQQELCARLDRLAGLPYVDLLDESDELLHHRYQLIYAWGAQDQLPAGEARARACQALLHLLAQPSSDLAALLEQEGVASWAGAPPGKSGAYPGLRLLPGAALEAVLSALSAQLAGDLVAQPPYNLRWMRGHPLQEQLLRCMTDPELDANAALEAQLQSGLSEDQHWDVLALRGLLACGVLVHCLRMRHLVDYGVNRTQTARKRLAVPFRAAHQPSDRSEFAQPDTALLLTVLAYYQDGLSETEMMQALQKVLDLGPNAQQAVYAEWLQLADGLIPLDDLRFFDDVTKLDTSNAQQMEVVYRHLSHNMGAVDFWLNSCVLGEETKQFPQRLVATAWHLADNPGGRVAGFSGTNDNHRLLPLQVQQHLEVEQGLRATNGKMLAVLLDNPRYDTLALQDEEPVWDALLHFAVHEGLDALIDCGALLVGTSNRDAATHLVKLLGGTRFRGVCYFDEEAFTIFDEARCRGADLKLRSDAVGLLTLGPATCKDKLMQAAGRLRRLGRGQGLRIVGTGDITAKICGVAAVAAAVGAPDNSPGGEAVLAVTSREVLQWCMANTVQATIRGVPEWAHQGLHFAATHQAPEHALLPEVLELADMYGGSRAQVPLPDLVAAQRARWARDGLDPGMVHLMGDIEGRSQRYGAGHQVVAQGGLGEECERELEREEEQEEEVEQQLPRVEAAAEVDWEYGKALGSASLADFLQRTNLQLMPLSALACKLTPSAVGQLELSTAAFCTSNFATTVSLPAGSGSLNEYLRPVSGLLMFPPADGDPASNLLADWLGGHADDVAGSFLPPLVSLQLFDGTTMYVDPRVHGSEWEAVRALPPLLALHELVGGHKVAAEALVRMRGKEVHFARSHLELACDV
ncbi:hypothetical protein N2152v2_009860 [Parachlorella kessleri]